MQENVGLRVAVDRMELESRLFSFFSLSYDALSRGRKRRAHCFSLIRQGSFSFYDVDGYRLHYTFLIEIVGGRSNRAIIVRRGIIPLARITAGTDYGNGVRLVLQKGESDGKYEYNLRAG